MGGITDPYLCALSGQV